MGSRIVAAFGWALIVGAISLAAQTPQPFPRPGQQPARPSPPPPTAPPPTTAKPAPAPSTTQPLRDDAPSEATLGVPLYPSAQFITSYDAGRGQRFYLYGVSAPYAEMVAYYKTALKQKGDELFEAPPTYQFETGRYRSETMAFPPSVTIKDYTWGGSAGYPNSKKGTPERFPTVIQIVPATP